MPAAITAPAGGTISSQGQTWRTRLGRSFSHSRRYQSVGAMKRALPLAVQVRPARRLDAEHQVRAAPHRVRAAPGCGPARSARRPPRPHGRPGVIDLEPSRPRAEDAELVARVLVQDLDVVDVLDAAVGPFAEQRVAVADHVDAHHVAARELHGEAGHQQGSSVA